MKRMPTIQNAEIGHGRGDLTEAEAIWLVDLLRRRLRGTNKMEWRYVPQHKEDEYVYPARLCLSNIVARSSLARDIQKLLDAHAPGFLIMGTGT